MRNDLSVVSATPRPVAAALARATALVLLTLLTVSCHSDNTTAPAILKSLEFTAQPLNTDAVTALGPIRVSALDGSGHLLTSYQGQVTIALATNPGGATLGGTKSVNVSNGVAVFSTLTVNRPGSYTLGASTSGISATSAAFTIVPGPVANLVFSVQPPGTVTAGSTIAPPIQVQALDAAGNLVTSFNGNVTMTIGTNPAGGTLSGTPTVAASGGVATFTSLSINKAGTGYKLTATAGAGSGQSNAFNITAGTATQLVFTAQPVQTAAGSPITPAVVVTAEDQFGNTANFTNQITIALTHNTGNSAATLSGTLSKNATSGAASFADLSIDSAATGYTLSATANGLVGAFASATFNIVPGVATRLVFTGQPAASTTAGVAISPAVVVTARDAKGNTATGFSGTVKVAISAATGTPGAKLSGADTVSATASGGVASFNTLRIDKNGTGYTLSASASGLTTGTSSAFTITVAPPVTLAFAIQPSNTAAGAAIAPTVQVIVQDSLGNTTNSSASIVLSITPGTGTAGALLTGGTSVTKSASAGVATFSTPDTLAIDKIGNTYTLTATSTSLTSAISTPFSIFANTATHLAFTIQPADGIAGPPATIPTVKVTALDASNNPVPGFIGGVTITITTGTGTVGATLTGGSPPVNAVSGVATFSNLAIDKTGDGYTLDASAAGLTGATSTAFKITPAAATHLVFTLGQPSDAVAGQPIAPAVKVAALDAHENVDTAFKNPITVALGTNPGSGNLGGTLIQTAVHGISTFADLVVDKSGTGYQLLATAGSLTSPLSSTFNITAAVAKQMTFTTQPVTTTAGLAITPAVVVHVQDSLGNTATGFNNPVKVAISSGTGTANAHLTNTDTVTVTAVSGVATLPNLRIDSAGSGYILSASTAGLTAALSTSFNILPGNATKLVFTAQPSSATAGVAIAPPVAVTARDSLGNRDTTFKTGITVALTGGSGTANAHLSHAASVTATAAAGIATFSTLSVDSAGNNYTLSASATGVSGTITGGPSAAFNIVSAPAVSLVITGQPVTAVAGATIPVQVTARDSLGNTAKSFDGIANQVTLTFGVNAGAGTLTGGVAAPTQGVTNFSVSINKVGTGYTLVTSSPFISTPSVPFDITPGAASQLAFTVQPAPTTVGAQISPAVTVTAQDAQGNTVPTFANNVTIAIGNNAGGGTLFGSVTRAAIGGVAAFSTLSIDAAGIGYTLTASSFGLSTGTSSPFNIATSVADHLSFTVQPATGTAGQTLPSISVAVQDASNQTVTTYTGNVTVAIASGPAGANLGGTKIATIANTHLVNGVATFNDLTLDSAGTNYKLVTTSGALTSATSRFFTVNPGAADHLGFTLQPSQATGGATITPQVEVTAFDNQGNVATAYTGNVSLAITSGTGTGGAVLGGTTPKAAVGGIATFNDLSINLPGNGYKLDAAGVGVATGATSAAFNITTFRTIHLAFTVQPSAATAGVAIPAIKVTALDSNNVVVTSFTNDVTLTITANTGTNGAVLSGTTTATTGNTHLVNGVATFNDVFIDRSGSGYKLSATASGAAGATSVSFAITAASATELAFTLQPASTTAGAALTPQVTVLDAFGNPVKNFPGTVSISLLPNVTGGSLFGTTSAAVDATTGIATFTNLAVNKSGDTYRLQAASSVGGVAPDTSNAFSISGGAPKQLLFSVQPSNAKANANINPDVRVTALDSLGNVSTGFTDVVNLAITNGTGTLGAVLSGGSLNATNGVADFSTVAIDRIGTGYTLTATTPTAGVSSTISVGFNITADRLVFTTPPTDPSSHTAVPTIVVAAEDGLGNTDASFTGSITISKASGTTGTLSGTTTATVGNGKLVNGVATFNDLTISQAGTGWSLQAKTTGLTTATSGTFTVN